MLSTEFSNAAAFIEKPAIIIISPLNSIIEEKIDLIELGMVAVELNKFQVVYTPW